MSSDSETTRPCPRCELSRDGIAALGYDKDCSNCGGVGRVNLDGSRIQTADYNPLAHWSDDDLKRTAQLYAQHRIREQQDLRATEKTLADIGAEQARRHAASGSAPKLNLIDAAARLATEIEEFLEEVKQDDGDPDRERPTQDLSKPSHPLQEALAAYRTACDKDDPP